MKNTSKDKNISRIKVIYDCSITAMAIVSVTFAIIDMISYLTYWENVLDTIIYFVFVIDYGIRFFKSDNKRLFIKHNVLDLVAIIPFNSVFRAFRILKIGKMTKIAKLLKLTKVVARGARSFEKIKRFLDTNGFKYVLLLALVSILGGSVAIMYVEKMNFVNALWWAFVTTTTVGYGDISPATGLGKVVASALMIVGIGFIGSLTSTITSFFLGNSNEEIHEDNSKVQMCLVLYNELNDSEKERFKMHIK